MIESNTLPLPVLVGEQSNVSKPTSVMIGIRLCYLSLVLSLVSFVVEFPQIVKTMPGVLPILIIAFVIFCCTIPVLFVAAVNKRKNWARITYLVLYIFGLILTLSTLADDFKESTLDGCLIVLGDLVQIVGFVYLFLPASSAWYKSVR